MREPDDRSDDHLPAPVMLGSDYVPEPPREWSRSMRERFVRVVEGMPAGWWTPSNLDLLHEYVRAMEMCDRLQARLDAINVDAWDWDDLRQIIDARDKESKRAMALARTMRLAQISVAPTAAAKVMERGALADAPWVVREEH